MPTYAKYKTPIGGVDRVEILGDAHLGGSFKYCRRQSDGVLLHIHTSKLFDMKNLAYRFREGAFRKYEAVIRDVCDEWPGPAIFTPDSVETFSCRLRDAIKSLRDNQWDTRIVPMAKFVQICDEIVVGIKGDQVVVGEREMVRRAPEPLSEISELTKLESIRLTTKEQFRAVCILRDGELLKNPVHCKLGDNINLTVGDIVEMEETYDVAIERKDPETIIVI